MSQSIFKTIGDGWNHLTKDPVDFLGDVGESVRDLTSDWLTNPGKVLADGVENVFGTTLKTAEDVGSNALDVLKKYWYVPVVIGGVFIGYKIVSKKKYQNLILQALAKR